MAVVRTPGLLADVPDARIATWYSRVGDWFGRLGTAGALLLLGLAAARPSARRGKA